MSHSKNFFSDLFDFSFSKFIAPKLVGLLYILLVFFAGLGVIFGVFGALASIATGYPLQGLGTLILTALGSLLYVIITRVSLEGLIIAFRTAENTGLTAENTKYLKQP